MSTKQLGFKQLSFGRPILKSGGNKFTPVRILRPTEYYALRDAAHGFELSNAYNLDGLLTTGMRYVEAQRFQNHPEWFDEPFVYLPREAQKKTLSHQRERWIKMFPGAIPIVAQFCKNTRKLPTWQTWRENLGRWARAAGMDPVGLSPKTTRKTYESWLAKTYPERLVEVAMRQGHTSATQARFYLNLPFTDEDVAGMKVWTEGVF